jgi:hypothetical protein
MRGKKIADVSKQCRVHFSTENALFFFGFWITIIFFLFLVASKNAQHKLLASAIEIRRK